MEQAFFNFMVAIDMEHFNVMMNSEWGKDVSYINILYLIIIGHNEHVTVSELAQKLKVSKAAVTQKINELEQMELIEKQQLATDKRVYYITLAPKVKQPINESATNDLMKAVNDEFTADELAITAKVLEFLTKQINKNK